MIFNSADDLNKYACFLSDPQRKRIGRFILGLSKQLEFSDDEIKILEEKAEKLNLFNEILYQTATLNNLGIQFEKNNELDKAIEAYEKNILIGYTATHSFTRLMIIYRKLKKYDEEIRVIKTGMAVMSSKYPEICEEWSMRLIKTISLHAKKHKLPIKK